MWFDTILWLVAVVAFIMVEAATTALVSVWFAVGAAAFTYHVEGQGPFLPTGTQLYQLIEDPAIAAWAPVGTAAVGNVRLGVEELLARPAPMRPART